jgi:hypothetical protein
VSEGLAAVAAVFVKGWLAVGCGWGLGGWGRKDALQNICQEGKKSQKIQ